MENSKELGSFVRLMETLQPKDQTVLFLRYGRVFLGEQRPMSYAEIGRRLGVSSGMVKTMIKKALRRVRHDARSKWTSEFL